MNHDHVAGPAPQAKSRPRKAGAFPIQIRRSHRCSCSDTSTLGTGSYDSAGAGAYCPERKVGPNPRGITPTPRIRLDRATSARLAHAVQLTGIPAAELIDTALQRLLSGGGSPNRSIEAQNKASGRAGLGWPSERRGSAPTIADLLPSDTLERFLEVWLVTGTNVLYTQAIGTLATLGDGGLEAVRLVADSMEPNIHERVDILRARWEGGQDA